MNWKNYLLYGLITITVLAGLVTAYFLVLTESKIQSEEVNQYIIQEENDIEPEIKESTPVDVLADDSLIYVLIGSDSREGENAHIASDEIGGARSDTTMVVHIAEDRSFIDAISIPRDSIVDIPQCMMSDGTIHPAQNNTMFNAAFSYGDNTATSIACTISTIQHNTGITVDGYALVDFVGFERVIDVLGGVDLTIPEDMRSDKAGLDVSEGTHTFNGQEALAYARSRTFEEGGGGRGSDLERIDRQQELMSSIMDKILNAGTLSNPMRLQDLISASLDSITVSPDLSSLNKIVGLAFSLRSLDSASVNFYTVPVGPWSEDKNRLIWLDESESWWETIDRGEALEQGGKDNTR